MSSDPAVAHIVTKGWHVGAALGEGAFGRVYEVSRPSDGVKAACKNMELPDNEVEKLAIDNEFKIMKALDHPSIVKCFDAWESTTHAFLTLELMTGGELFDRIITLKKFSEMMAADVTYQCLKALQHMHSKGIVHRDLKPENLLLADATPESVVKVTDFGLSHLMDAESKLMTEVCGTLAYIAPESEPVASRSSCGVALPSFASRPLTLAPPVHTTCAHLTCAPHARSLNAR
jgi:serine/threonine protein kinase